MTLFLDSALIDDARAAAALGYVRGITTNPTLMAKAGGDPLANIAALCDLCPGTVFYQLTGATPAEREAEAWRVRAVRSNVGLKIPTTPENLTLAAKLAAGGAVVAMTAIFSAAQVYLAGQTGARYVIPYVNRSTRLLGDGLALVREMRAVIDAQHSPVEILAASIKSPAEAAATVVAGAHHLTLPLSVITAMGQHPLSDQAIAEFAHPPA